MSAERSTDPRPEHYELVELLREVALFSNDVWLARKARTRYVKLAGKEPEL